MQVINDTNVVGTNFGISSTNKKILSVNDLNNMLEGLQNFEECINNFYNAVDTALFKFSTNSVVQSFYESGPFGKEKEEQLLKLRNAVKKYVDVLNSSSDSLIPKTKQFINEQKDLLATRK